MNRTVHGPGIIVVILVAITFVLPWVITSTTPLSAQSPETQATLGSGTVVTWAEPWGDPFLEPNSVNLMTADGTVFNVDAYPASEHTVESAAALTPEGQYTVLESGPEEDGGFFQLSSQTIFDPMLGDERTFFAYSRAWPSADRQWIIATQLQSMTPFFSRDLASIPASITVDGTALWKDVDPAAIISTVVTAGVDMSSEEPVPAGNAGTTTAPSSGASPRDIVANVPMGLPDRDTASDQPQEEDDASTYTSDMFGYTVAWEGSWIPFENVSGVNEEDGYDFYALQADGIGTGVFSLLAAGWDDDLDARDYIDYWASDEFVKENFPEGTEVVISDSRKNAGAVVYVGPQNDSDPELWVTVYEVANMDDEIRLEPTLIAPLSDFEDVYDDALQSITLDGDEVIGFFSTEEVVDELP